MFDPNATPTAESQHISTHPPQTLRDCLIASGIDPGAGYPQWVEQAESNFGTVFPQWAAQFASRDAQ